MDARREKSRLPASPYICLFESLATHNSKRICRPIFRPQTPGTGLLCGKRIRTANTLRIGEKNIKPRGLNIDDGLPIELSEARH